MKDTLRLEGKVAIVTGASSGIGRATALLFARHGAAVAASSNRPEELAALKRQAAGLAGPLLAVEADVTREDQVAHLVETTVERFGGLDILVNVAGIVSFGTVTETSLEEFDRLAAVNLRGVFLCSKYAVPHLRRRGGGAVVNVSSINGIRGNHRLAAYAATKGGVVALTYAMAIDHAPEGIRVNCVCPATIEDTGQTALAWELAPDKQAWQRYLLEKHPIGRLGRSEEVAQAILFLASEESSFLTGVALPVDGGRSIR